MSRHCRVSYALFVDLGLHVVIGVGRLTVQREGFIRQLNFTTHTQFQVQSYFLLDVVVRLCPVIVNSNCIPNSCMFHIAKTGALRCCLYSSLKTLRMSTVLSAPSRSRPLLVEGQQSRTFCPGFAIQEHSGTSRHWCRCIHRRCCSRH